MESMKATGQFTVGSDSGLYAADLAADGTYLYVLDRRSQRVLRFNADGGAAGEYATGRKYTRFCYDGNEECFWAVTGTGVHIYRLDASLKEKGYISTGIDDPSPVVSIKYIPGQNKLIAATRGGVYDVFKCGFSQRTLHCPEALLLFDTVGDNKILCLEKNGTQLVTVDRQLAGGRRIETPEGCRFAGETCVQKDRAHLYILFGKEHGGAIVYEYAFSSGGKEHSSSGEDLLCLLPMIDTLLSSFCCPAGGKNSKPSGEHSGQNAPHKSDEDTHGGS